MRHMDIFTGNVGQLKEVKELSNGNCVVNFSIAETPRIKKGEEWVDGETIWTNAAVFGDKARNFHRSVKQGTPIFVVGYRTANAYTPKDSTDKVVNQSIAVEEIGILMTKFNYVETLGNVNYAKEGTAVPEKTESKSKPAGKTEVDPFTKADAPAAFSDDEDDPFGLNG